MAKDCTLENPHRRKGFVARLPKTVRDQVNELILDGVPYTQILQRLGAAVSGITEDHLSTWRAGGYMDWLRNQRHREVLQSSHELAIDLLKEDTGTTIHDAGRQVVASQLCQAIIEFDPATLAERLQGDAELYMRVINALARLSEGDLACGNYRLQEAALKAKLATEQAPESPNVITTGSLKEAQEKLNLH